MGTPADAVVVGELLGPSLWGAGEAIGGASLLSAASAPVLGTASAGAFGGVTGGALAGATLAEMAAAPIAGLTAAGAAGGGLSLMGALNTAKDVATVISPIASTIQAASGIGASKKMGSISGIPSVSPGLTMPTAGGPVSLKAQQTSQVVQQRRRGRASTILTSPDALSEKLGSAM